MITSDEVSPPKLWLPPLTPLSARCSLRTYECASYGSRSVGQIRLGGVKGAAGKSRMICCTCGEEEFGGCGSGYVAGSNGRGFGALTLKTRIGQRSLGGTSVPSVVGFPNMLAGPTGNSQPLFSFSYICSIAPRTWRFAWHLTPLACCRA